MQSVKTYNLVDDPEPDIPFRLIGISISAKYYTVCHYLNKCWQVDFELKKTIPIQVEKDKTTEFNALTTPAYFDMQEITLIMFINKLGTELLLPKFSKFDLILKVQGNSNDSMIARLVRDIKSINGVLVAAEIPLEKVKQLERLHLK